jgi:hypothetical protein
VVVLGEPFVGIVHPCKIYNILRLGTPYLTIGPTTSHLTELMTEGDLGAGGIAVGHGDIDQVVDWLEEAAALSEWRSGRRRLRAASRYSKAILLPRLLEVLSNVLRQPANTAVVAPAGSFGTSAAAAEEVTGALAPSPVSH